MENFHRKFSNSEVSESTINSSAMSQGVLKRNLAATKEINDLNSTQNNVKIESSRRIQVGDVHYHIYNSPTSQDIGEGVDSAYRVNRFFQENEKTENISVSDTFSVILGKKNFRQKFCSKWSKKSLIELLISFIILIAVISIVCFFMLIKKNVISNDPFEIVPRSEWTDEPVVGGKLGSPAKRIIVGHTYDTESCYSREDCIQKIIDTKNSSSKDIPWNFLIGGDGRVYEGRGYEYEGEHTMDVNASDYNDIGIGIGFIGNFSNKPLPTEMMNTFEKFITKSTDDEFLSPDYLIFLQDQLVYKDHRAESLEIAFQEMGNFYKLQKFYPRKEWGALASCSPLSTMSNPLHRVIIHHSGQNTWQCTNYSDCTDEVRFFQRERMVGCVFSDTHYNFVIGGISNYAIVMEVRGFSKLGAHTATCNTGSLGIGLIGEYDTHIPGDAMMEALQQFMADSVALGKLTENYELNIKKDFDGASSPGSNVINIIENWPHFKKYQKP